VSVAVCNEDEEGLDGGGRRGNSTSPSGNSVVGVRDDGGSLSSVVDSLSGVSSSGEGGSDEGNRVDSDGSSSHRG